MAVLPFCGRTMVFWGPGGSRLLGHLQAWIHIDSTGADFYHSSAFLVFLAAFIALNEVGFAVRKVSKIVAVLAGVITIVTGVSLFSIYKASQHVPEFYREALGVDSEIQEPARDEFVAQATALASDLHRRGQWQTVFTADQINAWLALELATNYPDLLPTDLQDPRISIREQEATIACRYQTGQVSTVLSLTVDVYLHEPNVLALRIRRARAGALPVPLAQVLDGISHAARELNLRLEWRKTQGDPVALITFAPPRSSHGNALTLQTVELRDGELFVSGTIGPEGSAPESRPRDVPTARHDGPVGDAHPVVGSAEKETRHK
jgi:hypothetical protein